jgi:hypothetical protein
VVSRRILAGVLLAWGFSLAETRADVIWNLGGWESWAAAASGIGNGDGDSGSQTSSAASGGYNAFINLGVGPYPDAGTITTGNAQPWYDSPQAAVLFGGQPTTQQQNDFAAAVMQRVEQTFQLSDVPVTLTDIPGTTAAHTLSLVSNTSAQNLSTAIGMTYIGGNGFSFIDQEAKSVNTLDQLEWVVAHNISHELMLAFGVGENYDHSGNFIDAPNANFAMMTSPTATFSPTAAQALKQALQAENQAGPASGQYAQTIDPQPVPEPATIAIWGLAALGMILRCRRTGRPQATESTSAWTL